VKVRELQLKARSYQLLVVWPESSVQYLFTDMPRYRGEKCRNESSKSSNCDHAEERSNPYRIESHSQTVIKANTQNTIRGGDLSLTDKQRLRDLQERDEFADRLKKKDEEKTRNVAEPSGVRL
jgi:hypothetical protein